MEFNVLTPIIHISNNSNQKFNFTQTDDEEKFLQNKEKLGTDWYYSDKTIEYNYNSWGYRTKEFDDLNDEYILVFGCSFTEGIGLLYDDIWATKLSQKLNMDVFNLGMGGTGPDFSFYNTVLFHNFILNKKKFPKYVVYQWSFNERTSYVFFDQKYKINIETFSISYPETAYPTNYEKYFDWYVESFVQNKGEQLKQTNIYSILCNNIWEAMGIPVYHWTWGIDFRLKTPEIFHNRLNIQSINDYTNIRARDCSHNGHLAQDIVVDTLLKNIENGISK